MRRLEEVLSKLEEVCDIWPGGKGKAASLEERLEHARLRCYEVARVTGGHTLTNAISHLQRLRTLAGEPTPVGEREELNRLAGRPGRGKHGRQAGAKRRRRSMGMTWEQRMFAAKRTVCELQDAGADKEGATDSQRKAIAAAKAEVAALREDFEALPKSVEAEPSDAIKMFEPAVIPVRLPTAKTPADNASGLELMERRLGILVKANASEEIIAKARDAVAQLKATLGE